MIVEKSYHVQISLTKKCWSVRLQGHKKALKNFKLKSDAIEFARDLAIKDGLTLFVHREDGSVDFMKKYTEYLH